MNLKEMIKKDEGLRLKVYNDTEGKPTIGWGFCLDYFDISDAEYFLNKKILQATDHLNQFTWYKRLNDPRKEVCVNMIYNLGIAGFMGFKQFIRALTAFDWDRAEIELLDSKAARKLPERYGRLAKIIKTGEWPENY